MVHNTNHTNDYSNFVPLSCNAQMIHTNCQLWNDVFGARAIQQDTIVIPCGQCVVLDQHFRHDTLFLQGGLDIQGRLVMPERSTPLTVETPHVTVQGEWIMNATTSQFTSGGSFVYKIRLIGKEDHILTPIGDNRDKCKSLSCNVGSQVVAVIGGRVEWRGFPVSAPAWVTLTDVRVHPTDSTLVTALLIDSSVAETWRVGAEVLVTSFTHEWDGEQVRHITLVTPTRDPSLVAVHLDEPIQRPTSTMRDGVDTNDNDIPVEVALLSRNIVLEGTTTDALVYNEDTAIDYGVSNDGLRAGLGGQLVFYHTPHVAQRVQGVEIRNFGQQGYLGKYPIHFHFCEESSRSIVTKSVIRQSNQRCLVIHGTNNMLVSDNIAYDTKGHCFMLEDGHETGNKFIRNLGVRTSAPDKIIPNHGHNGYETDMIPSTFWVTNPNNIFIDNVAAGSQDSGFWFELKLRGDRAHLYPKLDPRRERLGMFMNNAAHSNSIGFRAYPSGYRPDNLTVIENFKAYRNHRGAFFHLSRNIHLLGGVYADNRRGLEIDRADNMHVEDVTFVGVSDSWKSLQDTQHQMRFPCFRDEVLGVEYHAWKNEPTVDGCSFHNIYFANFTNTGCKNDGTAMMIDKRKQVALFDLYTSFSKIQFSDHFHTNKMNMCLALGAGFTPFHTDLDGSLSPHWNPVVRNRAGPATLVADHSTMTKFLDLDICQHVPNGCYWYCPRRCFRGVHYEVDPYGTEKYQLHVCRRDKFGLNNTLCVDFPGYYKQRDAEKMMSTRYRKFGAYLPAGQYNVSFVDSRGNVVWPTFVQETFQTDELCPTALRQGDVHLERPDPTEAACAQLIRNANFDADHAGPWLQRFGGLRLVPGQGNDQSTALTSKAGRPSDTLVQFVDSRCLNVMDRQYKIVAWIKLVDENNQGQAVLCQPHVQRCPTITLEAVNDQGNVSYKEVVVPVPTGTQLNRDGYQLYQGIVTVGPSLAVATRVSLQLRSYQADLQWYVDNVRMQVL